MARYKVHVKLSSTSDVDYSTTRFHTSSSVKINIYHQYRLSAKRSVYIRYRSIEVAGYRPTNINIGRSLYSSQPELIVSILVIQNAAKRCN